MMFPRALRIQIEAFTFRFAILVGLLCNGQVVAAEGSVDFSRDIRPLLAEKCFACHGFDARPRQAGLRLDTVEGAHGQGESGDTAIKPFDRNASAVWNRISSADDAIRMPPPTSRKQLSEREKQVLGRWIDEGAQYTQHWAFVPPARPTLPAQGRNAIDLLIEKRLTEVGSGLVPEVDKETLLRRVSIDLTGLPPSLEEMQAFLADEAPAAYPRQVDRLLASSRYGEHMATHWLDVSRYGDTNGYLHDILRTGWPWRDWVIKAFNDDMPFDRFVTEQLAGDLLPSATPDQLLATAFCRNHLITAEGGTLAAEYLNEYAADRVQTAAAVFLGLGFSCCRCHDHKFDPLTQEDFYSLQAYFNSTTETHRENDLSVAYPPVIEIASPLAPAGPKAKVMVMQEAPAPNPTFVLTRGQYDQPNTDRPVSRRPPLVLGRTPADAPQDRLGLAVWLVSQQNPLLARVTVNRLWQQIFGTGLVQSVDDFGAQGDYPSHPELLDFLAVEFRDGSEDGRIKAWSTKHILRLIVTSDTYRQAATMRPELQEKDPENRLLGRFPSRRLTAEEIRDQALFASGLLVEELGGPPVFPYQPAGLWEERSNEGSTTGVYVRGTGVTLYRRSLYTFWKRTCPPPLMTLFDVPDRTACSSRRVVTNTPLQALATLNDEQMLECSKLLAVRTLREATTTRERLTLLFRRVTSRTPHDAELRILESGLNVLLERYQTRPGDSATLLLLGETKGPADLDAAQLAAWMLVSNAVLNLDESLMRK